MIIDKGSKDLGWGLGGKWPHSLLTCGEEEKFFFGSDMIFLAMEHKHEIQLFFSHINVQIKLTGSHSGILFILRIILSTIT